MDDIGVSLQKLGVRKYENGQQTWMILNGPEEPENKKAKHSLSKKKKSSGQLKVEIRWERKELIDAVNHIL
ncbi:1733_t:CDS:2, partial [Dentiscutata erythropus]